MAWWECAWLTSLLAGILIAGIAGGGWFGFDRCFWASVPPHFAHRQLRLHSLMAFSTLKVPLGLTPKSASSHIDRLPQYTGRIPVSYTRNSCMVIHTTATTPSNPLKADASAMNWLTVKS